MAWIPGTILDYLDKWDVPWFASVGWATRGYKDWSFEPDGILNHHTGSLYSSELFGVSVIVNGYSTLPGPLAQFYVHRNGNVWICAAGRCNHAGTGMSSQLDRMQQDLPVIPATQQGDVTGNKWLIGIEAEYNPTDGNPWPQEQLDSMLRLNAALCDFYGWWPQSRVSSHKEWTTRKVDPSHVDMDAFRLSVEILMTHEHIRNSEDPPASWGDEAWTWALDNTITRADGSRMNEVLREDFMALLKNYHDKVVVPAIAAAVKPPTVDEIVNELAARLAE